MSFILLNDLLENYSGRDKFLRLIYYGIKTFSGLCSKSTSSSLIIFNSHIDSCRTFLRLFDDLPMLRYTMSYGLGREVFFLFILLITGARGI